VTSGVTIPVVPLAYADNMPMITATSTHLNVTVDPDTGQVFTNMFRSCFIDPFQGYVMANFAFHEVGAQTAAILYNNEIDYSVGLMQTFMQQAEVLGLEVVAVEVFQSGAVVFAPQLANIVAQNPDVLFVPEYYQAVSLISQQALDAGLDATLLGADGWAAVVEFMDDPSPLNGAFFLSGFYPGLPEPRVQQFVSEFYDRTGTQPDMFAAQAYDAAMILFVAVEAALAEGFEPNTDEFKTSVIAHMAATDLTGVTGHVTFDEFNNPQKTAVVLHVEDGEETFWGYF
jgi:branched-chain amino acid transport system substrate-binding protein